MSAITSPRRQATPPEATITAMAESFRRALVAENKSPRTVQTYLESVARFRVFLVAERLPLGIAAIRREHIEAFVTDLLARFKPATASVRYRALQTFFKWLAVEWRNVSQSWRVPHSLAMRNDQELGTGGQR